MKKLSIIFWLLAILLSDIMCAVVTGFMEEIFEQC